MDAQQENDNEGVVELAQSALQANTEHLHALETYTQRLEAELETFDKLFDAVDTNDEFDLDVGCVVTIPGSVRGTAPLATKELLLPDSPFYQDARKRSSYQSFTKVHPMKPKELEVLAEAVRAESCRIHALETQKSGFTAFPNIDVHAAPPLGLNAEGIDWSRVAEKVSAVFLTTRTARECEIRWLGEKHPEFNHGPWNEEEELKVKSLAAEFVDGLPDWVAIAKRLGTGRTPLDCMRHATPRKSHQWTTDTDERLRKAIRMYGHDNWHLVACYVSEDATPSQCSHRFRAIDETIKRTNWSPEEDARLIAAVAAYGSSWVDVATNVPGRHSDQCRDRWTEQLNPSINKTQWSEEEDKLLLDYVREHKDASWKEISEHLGNGRTQAMCRKRYAATQMGAGVGSAISSEVQITSATPTAKPSDSVSSPTTLCFKSSFSKPPVCSDMQIPSLPEHRQPNRIVFLEPMVSVNPESHKRHRPHPSRPTAKSKTMGNILPSNATTMPPSKKRKTASRTAKSNGHTSETQSSSQAEIAQSERDPD